MIRILFFARLREELATDCLQLEFSAAVQSVAALKEELARRGSHWSAALAADNMLCAVNQQQAGPEQPLADGDEIAFFPPVTGG